MPTSERNSDSKAYDVVIVGAGVIGLAVGWRAARQGLRTLVLEAASPGMGATHAAAGMLAPVTEANYGEERLVALGLEAARRYPGFVAELEHQTGLEVGYRPCGTLAVALDRDEAELLKRLHEFQLSLGLESEWLRSRDCRRLEPGLAPRVVGGIRSGLDHQVSSRALARGLVAALEAAGAELRAGVAVAAIAHHSRRVTGVELQSGEGVSADQVVIAAGWRSGDLGLPEEWRVPVRPVKGQIIRLRGDRRAPVARRVVRTPEVYVVPRADGRVVVGATVEERGADTAVTAGGVLELLRSAYAALPGIAELELVEATAGLRPAAPDNAPVVGSGGLEGLVWATAHWRNGILLAPLTADAVVALLTRGEESSLFEPFSPARFAREPLAARQVKA
jgi:glycine oxidase